MFTVRSLKATFRRHANAVATGITAALLLVVLLYPGAAAASPVTLSLEVNGFSYLPNSTLLNAGQPGCPATATPERDGELHGYTYSVGALIEDVTIPQGAKLAALRLTAFDADSHDAYAYLVRKRLTHASGLVGAGGYKVLAAVHSSGNSPLLRQFATSAISSPAVDDINFAYYVEVINCYNAVAPIGVQVVYSK